MPSGTTRREDDVLDANDNRIRVERRALPTDATAASSVSYIRTAGANRNYGDRCVIPEIPASPAVNRLTRVDMPSGTTRREDYVLDANDNRIRVERRALPTGATAPAPPPR